MKRPEELTIKELWENKNIVETYNGGDARHLIGKHYVFWYGSKLHLIELSIIPISQIKKTSENLKAKKPVYKDLITQAPPICVELEKDGTYRLFDGHRRLKSAIARGEKFIFAEIHHGEYKEYMKRKESHYEEQNYH